MESLTLERKKEFTEIDFCIKVEIEKYLKTKITDCHFARTAIGSWKETLESEDVLYILKKLNSTTNNGIESEG